MQYPSRHLSEFVAIASLHLRDHVNRSHFVVVTFTVSWRYGVITKVIMKARD